MRLISKSRIVINPKIAWLLVFTILSMLVVGWLIYASKSYLEKKSTQISRTYETIGTIQNLVLTVTESGISSYRYLETGDPRAARELQSAHTELRNNLDSLQRFTRKNCDQDTAINLLTRYIAAKCQYEDSLLAASRPPSPATAAINRLTASDSWKSPSAMPAKPNKCRNNFWPI